MSDADHTTQPEPLLRLSASGAAVRGGVRAEIGRWLALTLTLSLALMCPFAWAWVVFAVLRSSSERRRTVRELLGSGPGDVEVDDKQILLTSYPTTVVDRADIIDGWLEPFGGDSFVVARLEGGKRLLVEPRQPGDAERLLQVLGIDVDRLVAKFPLASRAVDGGQGAIFHLLGPWLASCFLLPWVVLMVNVGASLQTLLPAMLVTAVVALGVWRFARYVTPGEVAVGADGLSINRMGEQRFVSYADVADVEIDRSGKWIAVVVRTQQGDISMRCGTFAADAPDIAEALAARLDNALAAYRRRRQDDVSGLALLERGGRDVATWRADLRELARERGDYRRARIQPTVLAEVIEDATESVERRVGAAVALSARPPDATVQQRVRIAARSCANESLRIAIERSFEGELELADIEAALADIEAGGEAGAG